MVSTCEKLDIPFLSVSYIDMLSHVCTYCSRFLLFLFHAALLDYTDEFKMVGKVQRNRKSVQLQKYPSHKMQV